MNYVLARVLIFKLQNDIVIKIPVLRQCTCYILFVVVFHPVNFDKYGSISFRFAVGGSWGWDRMSYFAVFVCSFPLLIEFDQFRDE